MSCVFWSVKGLVLHTFDTCEVTLRQSRHTIARFPQCHIARVPECEILRLVNNCRFDHSGCLCSDTSREATFGQPPHITARFFDFPWINSVMPAPQAIPKLTKLPNLKHKQKYTEPKKRQTKINQNYQKLTTTI